MSLPVGQIEAEALELPEEDRARLAERLLQSLEASLDPETERVQAEEAERRQKAMVRDGDSGIPAEEVLAELNTSLA